MNNLEPGDKIKVVDDRAGHGYKMGTILTIKQLRDRHPEGTNYTEVHVMEGRSFLLDTDVKKVYPENKKPGKFIITDPIFIMDRKQYEEIYEGHNRYEEPDFENQAFPLKSKHCETREPFIIHFIETTPYGGGGEYMHGNESIACDSGMLCIAENPKEWLFETYGAKFDTLKDSMDIFQNILNKF